MSETAMGGTSIDAGEPEPSGAGPEPELAPERQIARDIARRALYIAPLWLVICGAIWGIDGAVSGGYALGLVAANFLVAAALLTWAARVSPAALMAAALGGFVLRLAAISVAVLAVRNVELFQPVALGTTIVVTHLGLLIWETRYVSLSLAYPGLAPDARRNPGGTRT